MNSGVRGGLAALLALGGLAAAGAALAQGARSGDAQAQAGHDLYNARCAMCHAADLGGHGFTFDVVEVGDDHAHSARGEGPRGGRA